MYQMQTIFSINNGKCLKFLNCGIDGPRNKNCTPKINSREKSKSFERMRRKA